MLDPTIVEINTRNQSDNMMVLTTMHKWLAEGRLVDALSVKLFTFSYVLRSILGEKSKNSCQSLSISRGISVFWLLNCSIWHEPLEFYASGSARLDNFECLVMFKDGKE